MATITSQQTSESNTEEFDRKDLIRLFARLRHEVGGLVDDAKRKAALKVLEEFTDCIDQVIKLKA